MGYKNLKDGLNDYKATKRGKQVVSIHKNLATF